MFKLFVIIGLAAAVLAAPQGPKNEDVQILRYENDNDGTGSYRFAFEQSDGSKREEQGEVINQGTDDESIVMRGSYSWVGPDGVVYTVTYIADDKGFQPTIEQGAGGAGGAFSPAVAASLIG